MQIEHNSDIGKQLGHDATTIVNQLAFVGEELSRARRNNNNIEDVVALYADGKKGFTLEHTVNTKPSDWVQPSVLRIVLGLAQKNVPYKPEVLSRDKIRIRKPDGSELKGVKLDSPANYKDGDPNWAVHKHIKQGGEIVAAAIYTPQTGEFYIANEDKAFTMKLPTFSNQKLKFEEMHIPELRPKFAAEHGSWHTKERSLPKAIITTLMRENMGGSLHESAMKETPFAWVGTGARGITMIGNLKPNEGETGRYIAEKAGAICRRDKIITDNKNRDVLIAVHPKIAEKAFKLFEEGIRLSRGDVITKHTEHVLDPALVEARRIN